MLCQLINTTPTLIFFKSESQKKGITESIENFKFDLKYKETKLIPEKKLKDLQALLPYIPPVFHPFYISLKASGPTVNDNRPENVDGVDEENMYDLNMEDA